LNELRLVVKNAIEALGLRRENERLRAETRGRARMGGLLGAKRRDADASTICINKWAATRTSPF